MLVPNLCDRNCSIFKEKFAWLHCQLHFSLVETGQSKTFLGKYVIYYVYLIAVCLYFYRHFSFCRLICGLSHGSSNSSHTLTFSIRLPTFVSYRYIKLSTLLGDFLSTPKTSWRKCSWPAFETQWRRLSISYPNVAANSLLNTVLLPNYTPCMLSDGYIHEEATIRKKSGHVNQNSPNQIAEDKAYRIILFTWSFQLVDNSRNGIISVLLLGGGSAHP